MDFQKLNEIIKSFQNVKTSCVIKLTFRYGMLLGICYGYIHVIHQLGGPYQKKKTLPVVLDTANQIARFEKYRQLASECPNQAHSCFIYLNMDIPLHDL